MPSTGPTSTLLVAFHSILVLLLLLQTGFSKPTIFDNLISRNQRTHESRYPMVASGSANKPGFDMIHHDLSKPNNLRDKRQVGVLATALRMAPTISIFAT